MKLTCCCFTCIIGEDEKDGKEETNRLIDDAEKDEFSSQDKLHSKIPGQPSYSRSVSAVSSSSTFRGFSTESGEPISESTESSIAAKEKFSKAVGVLKKYNVMSTKYNTKELQRQLSSPARLRLKVGIKILQRSALAKVCVIEAHDVHEILQSKEYTDIASSTEGEPTMVIQVRTKIIHSEVRGHTRKYEIQSGLTGALKLKNETIHSIDLEEFLHSKIRFRLYYVLKHQRDKLLGEYVLSVSSLNLDTNTAMSHIMFEMYDPANTEPATSVNAPEITPVTQRMQSTSESQSSTEVAPSAPKIQRQPKIRSQDSTTRIQPKTEPEKGSFEELHQGEKSEEDPQSPFSKAFKSIRHGASHMLSKDNKEKDSRSVSSDSEQSSIAQEQLTANEKLKLGLKERSEKVEELEDTTAAMANTASNFSALSVRLREKYQAEATKKSRSSES